MVDDYLSYLGTQKEPPSEGYLRKLVIAHEQKVVVENLDFYYEKRPLLDINRIFRKILSGRGGVPLHLNVLFGQLLKQIGFSVELNSVQRYDATRKTYLPRLSGVALKVNLDGKKYFVDVADVAGLLAPLEIAHNRVFLNDAKYYRWDQEPFDDKLYLTRSIDAQVFSPYLLLEEQEVQLIEFLPVNDRYQEANHEMTKHRWMFKRINNGYASLRDNRLEIMEYGKKSSISIDNEEAFWSISQQHFGIESDQVFNQEAGT